MIAHSKLPWITGFKALSGIPGLTCSRCFIGTASKAVKLSLKSALKGHLIYAYPHDSRNTTLQLCYMDKKGELTFVLDLSHDSQQAVHVGICLILLPKRADTTTENMPGSKAPANSYREVSYWGILSKLDSQWNSRHSLRNLAYSLKIPSTRGFKTQNSVRGTFPINWVVLLIETLLQILYAL